MQTLILAIHSYVYFWPSTYLWEKQITSLVIVGLTTDHCISTSTRMAANLGFQVFLVSDGTATFDRVSYNGKYYPAEAIHEAALTSLHEEFAVITNTDSIIATTRQPISD